MSDIEQPVLLSELDDEGVLLLTLNRPHRLNAFNEALWEGLARTLDDARTDPRVAVVVLTGAGGNFSSGVDLSAFTSLPAAGDDPKAGGYFVLVEALFAFNKPLLCAVEGVAIGGGCTLTLAADFTYAGENLRMRLPFANLGLVPEIASSYMLQANIGRQRANELMFTAEWIDAARALEMGMVARVLPVGAVLPAMMEKAHQISRWPISSLVGIKRTLRAAHGAGIARARQVEDQGMAELAGSPENMEAIMAFMEKRRPDFKKFRR
jgi:enoyl-CoA hydratase/carnithine racemase